MNPIAGCYVEAISAYDMRRLRPDFQKGEIGSQRYPIAQKMSLDPRTSPDIGYRKTRLSLDVTEMSLRSRSIGRDVAFFEVAPIPRFGAGSTDRHWGCRDFGEAEGRTSGDAMWRWRWATTLLYTSLLHAGARAGTFPARVRKTKTRARRPTACLLERHLFHCCASAARVCQVRQQIGFEREGLLLPSSMKDNYNRPLSQIIYGLHEVNEETEIITVYKFFCLPLSITDDN